MGTPASWPYQPDPERYPVDYDMAGGFVRGGGRGCLCYDEDGGIRRKYVADIENRYGKQPGQYRVDGGGPLYDGTF